MSFPPKSNTRTLNGGLSGERTDNQTKLEHCWNEKWMNHQTKAKWRKIMNNKNVNSFHDEIPPRPECEHPFLRTRSNTNWGHHIEIVLPILRNYKQRPPCLPVLISFVFLIPIVPILWWIPIQSDYGLKYNTPSCPIHSEFPLRQSLITKEWL